MNENNINPQQENNEPKREYFGIVSFLTCLVLIAIKIGVICLVSFPFCYLAIKYFGQQAYMLPLFAFITIIVGYVFEAKVRH